MSETTSIYAIAYKAETGDYIEAGGYFTTVELASAAMARHPDKEWEPIEELTSDVCYLDVEEQEVVDPDVEPKQVHEASLKIIWQDPPKVDMRTYEDRSGKIRPGGFTINFLTPGGHFDRVVVESEVNMEHAIGIAHEARRAFIQQNQGKLDYDPDWHLKPRFPEGVA